MSTFSSFFFKAIPIIIFLFYGCSNGKTDSQNPPQRSRQGLAVNAVVVKLMPLERNLTLSGTLISDEMVELKAETSGKLVELNIDEGKNVRKGQLLARVNDNEIRARLKKLNLDLKLAQEELTRKTRLLAINALSQQEVDIAQNKVDGLKAEIDLSNAQVEKAEIRAPFDGRIGLRNVSPGGYVSSATTLATLVKDNPIKLEFALPERYVASLTKDKTIEFSLGHHPKVFKATIYATESTIDPTTRSLKIRALVPNPEGELISGFFARVQFRVNGDVQSLIIPPHALIPALGGQTVAQYKSGKVTIVPVEIGTRTPTSVEIIQGIQVGDTLIVSGLLQVRNGIPVNITIQDSW